MTRKDRLQKQMAQAERLAISALDKLTIDRIQAFILDCRRQLNALKDIANNAAEA